MFLQPIAYKLQPPTFQSTKSNNSKACRRQKRPLLPLEQADFLNNVGLCRQGHIAGIGEPGCNQSYSARTSTDQSTPAAETNLPPRAREVSIAGNRFRSANRLCDVLIKVFFVLLLNEGVIQKSFQLTLENKQVLKNVVQLLYCFMRKEVL